MLRCYDADSFAQKVATQLFVTFAHILKEKQVRPSYFKSLIELMSCAQAVQNEKEAVKRTNSA